MLSPNFEADVARLAKTPRTRRHEIYAAISLRESARLRPIIPNRKALSRFVKSILTSLGATVAELDAAKARPPRAAMTNVIAFPIELCRRVA